MTAMLPPAPQGRAVGVWRHALSLAGPARARCECSERRCMPSLRHASPRRPRRGAQRRARRRRDREAPRHAPQRGRSRAAAAQLRWDGGKRRRTGIGPAPPIPPFCVTLPTPSPANGYGCGDGPRLAQFRPRFLRPLQLQRKVRYASIHRPYFSAVLRHRSLSCSAATVPPRPRAVLRPRAPRRRRYVDGPYRIGTGSPTSACTTSARPSIHLLRAGAVAVPIPVLLVVVPRVLPGFSGSSQVHLSRM
nr:MAG TPA: hypothetical protein [Caudoviricetes sp.]